MPEPIERLMAEVLPHPGNKNLRIVNALCRRGEALSKDYGNRKVVPVVFTTPSEDRHGSVFEPAGWEFEPFNRNPVVDWSHMDKLPLIANARNLRQGPNSEWLADLDFADEEWSDYGGPNFARLIFRLMEADRLRGVSQSFIPKEIARREAKTIPLSLAENVIYKRMELTAITVCNVGSNREALRRSVADGFATANDLDVLTRLGVINFDLTADVPIVLGSRDTASESIAKERQMPTRTVEEFRSRMAETLKRCCGCEPVRDPKPETITEEQKTADLAAMTAVVSAQLTALDAALAGWRATSQNHLRGVFSGIAINAMYSIEGLIWRAKEWYGTDLAVTVPEYSDEDLEKIAAATDAGYEIGRAVAKASRRSVPVAERTATRGKIAELLRCCGCPSEYEEKVPTLPTDEATRAAEIAILRDLADVGMQIVEAGLRGWKSATTADLRDMAKSSLYDGMWLFDRCARYLEKWYGEQVEVVPVIDLVEVGRALEGFDARANRMAGPFEYASTQVNLSGDAEEAVLALAAKIPDEVLAEKGREADVHVTVKFGIEATVKPEEIIETLANSDTVKEIAARGAKLVMGATAIFDESPDYDVVYVAVESEDLVALNRTIADGVATTDTQDKYVPHVTLAYVKKGEGSKYAGDETLKGREITFEAIQYSDVDGELTEIDLAAAVATRDIGSTPLRFRNTGDLTREPVTASQPIRMLAPDASRDRREESPTPERSSLYVTLLSD